MLTLRQVGELPAALLAAGSIEIVLQVCPAAIVVAAVLGKGADTSVRRELVRMVTLDSERSGR